MDGMDVGDEKLNLIEQLKQQQNFASMQKPFLQ